MTRIFDADGNEITPPPRDHGELEPIGEIGGAFDETSATLSVYAKHLDREEVSALLEVHPTKAWNPGERHPIGSGKSGKTRIVNWGKWMLTMDRNRDPVEAKIRQLLQRCTSDLKVWHTLASKYDLWLTIGAHLENWNRELDLAPDLLQFIAERRLMLKIDVYFDGDEEDAED